LKIKELLVETEYDMDFHLMDDNKTIYLEFNPKCKICDISLKDKEFEKLYKDPAAGNVIERDYLCPNCHIHTAYKIMDFSLALKDLMEPLKQRSIPTINIIKDPFLEPAK
jgi:hypothetical protein